jgi:1,4-dihydroxy-2-naphthoate octaprenyltransferase
MSTHAEFTESGTRPNAVRIWFLAARPHTLPVGLAPVLVGTALAIHQHAFSVAPFLAALLGALFIQVGANLSNDYSDARRGADTDDRLGPLRVTAGELIPPRQVLIATWVSFGLAVLCGIYLIVTVGWIILAIGAASIVAGLLYTGGPRPYGYEGLGEVFVFLFFGLVAVTGTHYVLAERFDTTALALAVPVGLMAAAVLVVNNVRDIDTDRRAGKNTLAVRLGRPRTRRMYAGMLGLAYVLAIVLGLFAHGLSPVLLIVLLSSPLAVKLSRTVATHTDGPTLNGALAGTGRLELVFCLLLSAGILLS